MSHFTCFVVLKNNKNLDPNDKNFRSIIDDAVEKELRPFCENADKEFLEYVDLSEEYRKEYEGIPILNWENKLETKRISAVIEKSTGRILGSKYDTNNPEIKAMYQKDNDSIIEDTNFVCPDGFEEKELLPKEIYSTFKEYVLDYHNDEEMGYYSNPNAKWDWYEIGGRWMGMFKPISSNVPCLLGKASWATRPADPEKVDVIQKKNIDVEGMITANKNIRQKEWDEYWLKSNIDLNTFKTWSQLLEEKRKELETDKLPKETMAILKIKFKEQEGYAEYERLNQAMGFHFGSAIEYFCLGDYDEFMKRTESDAISSYSILKDGNWFEKGQMGWFRIKLTETENFEKTWRQIFDSIDDDDWVVNVDCHI